MTEVAENTEATESTEPTEGEETKAEGATDESTAETDESPVAVDYKSRILKSINAGQTNKLHVGFIDWIAGQTDNEAPEMDLNTVIAVQSLYTLWRQTDVFKDMKKQVEAERGTGTKPEPMPQTPEEARKMLEAAERKEKAAKQNAEVQAQRAQRARELLANMAAEQGGDTVEGEATSEEAEVAEDSAPETELSESF